MENSGHGIGDALYVNFPVDGELRYQPYMNCLCGWSTEPSESWQVAGAKLDEHLRDVLVYYV